MSSLDISPISFFFPTTVMSVPAKVYPITPVTAITIELMNTFEFNSTWNKARVKNDWNLQRKQTKAKGEN